MKKPIPGTLVEYNKDGFDEYNYIDEGTGFIEYVDDEGEFVKVYIFNRVRYLRKNWSQIMFGASQQSYTTEEFYKLFKTLSNK